MRLYPAIDIINGKCVRLVQGDYHRKTTFAEDPLKIAEQWQAAGCEWIHVVDLDGARSGDMPNFELITSMAKSVDIPIEVGGGIRDMEAVSRYLEAGVRRVIIGTAALRAPDFVKDAVREYGSRIAVGIDAKDGMAAVSGWEEVSRISALSLAKAMEQIGVSTLIYTDIATDGMLKGPNFAAMKEMAEYVSVDVIASGGVSTLEDLKKLSAVGVGGAIVGKALYTGHIDATEAAALCKSL